MVVLSACVDGATYAQTDAGAKRVLALHVIRRDSPRFDDTFRSVLRPALPEGLDYYSEYIDLNRIGEEKYDSALRGYLRARYFDGGFDLVIASGPAALEFLNRNPSLFEDVPIVFTTRPGVPGGPHSTGIVSPVDFTSTLGVALSAQPGIKHVYVVSGVAAFDRVYADLFLAQRAAFESQVAFHELAGLPLPELVARVRHLPPNSIVFYLSVSDDGAGHTVLPLDALEPIAVAANAPVYSWHEDAMGHGIVGGRLHSSAQDAQETARIALRVLRGEKPESIPVATFGSYAFQFDWRQLERWKIDRALLPAGSIIRYREASFFERYRPYVLGGTLVFSAQALLIGGLLVQRRRRRRAEEALRHSETRNSAILRALAGRLIVSQEEERQRIARELHDDLSQKIALLNLDVDQIAHEAPSHRTRLQRVSRQVRELAGDLSALSHKLHPSRLQTLGLIDSLRVLCAEISEQRHVHVVFSSAALPAAVDPAVSLCLYRIAQEALHNVAKHSRAREASVTLTWDGDRARLQIADSGVGFEPVAADRGGLGLVSMRERVGVLEGDLTIHTSPGGGTRIDVSVPLAGAAREEYSTVQSA